MRSMLTTATHSASDVIAQLRLEPLPREGGWFRRTATANDAARSWSAILALFTSEQFSALHRLTSDEIWIFQAGDPLELFRLHETGTGDGVVLGGETSKAHQLHASVPAGVWQGARPCDGGRWSLVSCVVVPEFKWDGFELGRREDLVTQFPLHAETISRLTRA